MEAKIFMRRLLKSLAVFLFTGLVLAGAVLSFGGGAKADVVYEPVNSFYQKHVSSCELVERVYAVNCIGDSTAVYESPVSDKQVATVLAGEEFWVGVVYTAKDGIKWAYIDSLEGWIPNAYLTNIYDEIMFRQQNKADIESKDGTVDPAIANKSGKVFFYSYPGSKEFFDFYNESDSPYYTMVYVDPYGHEWGYVSYYYLVKGWVCLDDTDATYEELYPNGQSFSGILEKAPVPTEVILPNTKANVNINIKLIVGIIIGVIVLASAAVIAYMLIKKKKNK